MFFDKIKCLRSLSTKINNSCYVTTPIFYVNASPHIGHLYSAVIADAIIRYKRLLYPESKTFLSTGTDEHGLKIQQASEYYKTPVGSYCDQLSESYKSIFKSAGINFNKFIRTTDADHVNAVQHFWNELTSRGHIYSAQYSGWYCVADETFLTESQLTVTANGTKVSLESGHPIQWTEERNYMFQLSAFQQGVIDWIKKGNRIVPNKFEKILLNYLSDQLPDISISRPSDRVHWAIPVPDDSSQTVYVWLDALINYLTCVGYPNQNFKSNWPPTVQVIGKDILKFHGIYWPAFLIAAGLEPPEQLLVHSHWTVNGQKMSKSKFNVVDPTEVSETYTMEGLRYFLLREGVSHSDGNYSAVKAVRILNSELADTLGNLLSRCCAKSLNPRQIYPRVHLRHMEELSRSEVTERLIDHLYQLPENCTQHYDEYNFYLVVDQIMATLRAANAFFEFWKPWELKKNDKDLRDVADIEKTEKLETIIGVTLDALKTCSIILQPIIPEISGKILNRLNVPSTERYWKHLNESFIYRSKEIEEELGMENNMLFQRILNNGQQTKMKRN